MVELPQNGHLPEGPLCVCGILKGFKDLLKCVLLLGLDMLDFPNMPVGPTADLLLYDEPAEYVRIDVLSCSGFLFLFHCRLL